MAHEPQSFDAYYKWLGIPPDEQPPHHYRLLAIQPFETDLDVIESAADQRMAHVRGRQTGKNSALSQKLLNEIAAAKVELLHPERKQEYDTKLRQMLGAREPKVAQSIALPEQSSIQVDTRTGPVAAARQAASRRGSGWMIGVAIAVALVILSAFGITAFLSRSTPEIAVETRPTPPGNPDKPTPTPAAPPVVPTAPEERAQAPVPTAVPDPPTTPTLALPEAPIAVAVAGEPSDANPPTVENSIAFQPNWAAKLPVPEAALLDKARQTVREIYAKSFADAKSPEQKAALAATIAKQGSDTADDPPGKYVLFDTARRMAEQAGDLELTLNVCDHLANAFAVEAFPLQQSALDACNKLARKQADWQTIARAALTLLESAIAADDYIAAERFGSTALAAARKARDKDLIARATDRSKDVAATAAAYTTAQDAFAKLKTDSDDPDSNLAAGKFLCFVKGDWSGGLVHLARGSDKSLAELAHQDLDGASNDARWVTLGDGWLALAEKANEPEKNELQRRAAHWYRLALPMLTGLSQVRVEKLIAGLPQDEIKSPPVTTRSKRGPWVLLVGFWKITYADGAVRRYSIDDAGSVVFVETQQRATLARRDQDIVLDFGDGKVERLGVVGQTLLIDHFNPATSYPAAEPLRGRGVKEEAFRHNNAESATEAGGLLTVFEDEPEFIDQLKEGGGEVALETRDVYYGKGAARVTRDQRFVSFLPGFTVRIRETPGPGSFATSVSPGKRPAARKLACNCIPSRIRARSSRVRSGFATTSVREQHS